MPLPEEARLYEDFDLPPIVAAINKIVYQPFFGRIPETVRFAVFYHPSRFWIYGNSAERYQMVGDQQRAWERFCSARNMSLHERMVAMGYGTNL